MAGIQSHTFSSARGVPIAINGSTSAHHLHQQASTSDGRRPPRSASLNLRARQREEEARAKAAAHLPPTYTPLFHNEASIRRMRYSRLGRTDLVVSNIGLGCSAIGGLFGEVDDSIQAIIENAIKDGVNIIDTAYWYGKERSESILGKVLSKIPRSSFYLCTKIGRFELDFVRNFDYRADKVLEAVMESLKRLRVTYVDICFLQIHDIEYDKYEKMVLFETLQALEMAKQSGKIRFIGLTGYSLPKMAQLLEAATVQIDVVMSYCHGALNDNSLGRYMSFFQSRGLAVINSSPLTMGLLTLQGPPPWHPSNTVIRESVQAAVDYCTEKNISIERLALDYAFTFPGCSSCFVGMDSVAHVRTAVDLAIGDAPITAVEQRVRDRIMRRYLDPLDNAGWEGIDTASYWKRLKRLGLPALATHRHSSVESLASTLNGLSMRSTTTSSSDIVSLRGMRRRAPCQGPSLYSSRGCSLGSHAGGLSLLGSPLRSAPASVRGGPFSLASPSRPPLSLPINSRHKEIITPSLPPQATNHRSKESKPPKVPPSPTSSVSVTSPPPPSLHKTKSKENPPAPPSDSPTPTPKRRSRRREETPPSSPEEPSPEPKRKSKSKDRRKSRERQDSREDDSTPTAETVEKTKEDKKKEKKEEKEEKKRAKEEKKEREKEEKRRKEEEKKKEKEEKKKEKEAEKKEKKKEKEPEKKEDKKKDDKEEKKEKKKGRDVETTKDKKKDEKEKKEKRKEKESEKKKDDEEEKNAKRKEKKEETKMEENKPEDKEEKEARRKERKEKLKEGNEVMKKSDLPESDHPKPSPTKRKSKKKDDINEANDEALTENHKSILKKHKRQGD